MNTAAEFFIGLFFLIALGLAAYVLAQVTTAALNLAARGAIALVSKARTSLAARRAERLARKTPATYAIVIDAA